AEALVDVVAATDGLVVSSGTAVLDGYEKTPVQPRYDVIYLLDEQGWYYRYSHLHSFDAAVKPGARVKMGHKLGLLGKEGGSGGWSHLPSTSPASSLPANGAFRKATLSSGKPTRTSIDRSSRPWPGRITWPGSDSR